MGLKESWLKFTRDRVDKMMLELQRSPDVSLDDWKQIQEDYKKTYGEYYDRDKKKETH